MRRVLVALALLLAACSGDGDGPEDARRTTTSTSTTFPYFLPTFLPFGFQLKSGERTVEGPGRAARVIAIGRPVSAGAFTDVALVLVNEAAADRESGPNERAATRLVDVNGTQARVIESPLIGASVDWFAGRLAVGISGPVGSADLLLDIARRLELPESGAAGDTRLPARPDGFEVIAEAAIVDHAPEQSQTLSIAKDDGATIAVVATKSADLPLIFVAGGGDATRPDRVGAHDAVVSIRTRQLPNGTSITETTIAWRDGPNAVLAISASAGADVLMPIAVGMARVSEADWLGAVPP